MRATASCVCPQVGQNVEDYRRTECASHVPAIKNFFKVQQIINAARLEMFYTQGFKTTCRSTFRALLQPRVLLSCPLLWTSYSHTHDYLFWFVVTVSCPQTTSCCIAFAPAFKWSLCGVRTEAWRRRGGGGGAGVRILGLKAPLFRASIG